MKAILDFIIRIFNKPVDQLPSERLQGRVAICVGHSRIGDRGAVSVGKVSEWVYNSEVAEALRLRLEDSGVDVDVISAYPRHTYRAAMKWLADRMQGKGYDCVLELHFNSSGKAANGYEYLYLKTSTAGKRLAWCLNSAHNRVVGGHQRNRGSHPVSAGQRGYSFLSLTPAPAVICEPFFGSNENEWAMYAHDCEKLAGIYFEGVKDFLSWLHGKTASQSAAPHRSLVSDPAPLAKAS